MKISVDGGGLCADENNRFGNYVFSENLIRALLNYDTSNQYYVYSFCPKPKFIKQSKNFIYKNLQPKLFWSSIRVSVEAVIDKKDYFLALNQSIPLIKNSKIISFSHGLSYYFFPKFYPDSQSKLKRQMDRMIDKSDRIVVSSIKVRNELRLINQSVNTKIEVIPYGVSDDMSDYTQKQREKFFLFVGMDHPIKNIDFIVEAFERFKNSKTGKGFRLILVSNIILNRWSNDVIIINNPSRVKLKQLYQEATALLTASLYESFNLPVLEALAQNCPVISLPSAIIPEQASFVNIAGNKNEFVSIMKNAVNNQLSPINIKKINQTFSWEKYVSKIINLYTLLI